MATKPQQTADDAKPIRLTLSSADHAELRVAAARAGKPMSEYARLAVLAAIKADRPTRK